ncbi:MAG: D-glycero-beta-D-manno-heptose-7-phosphate kinase [Acidobacteria bacterium]|nr:MAG: D-glycero-beta-D-manno-heptose-7-phosphate kinase [Acidobacteriota bacterium]
MTPGRSGGGLPDWSGRRVVVVGEAIVDRYWYGQVERISPEAPVPVVRVGEREIRPGGAANVAANLAALGLGATLVTALGRDEAGRTLARELAGRGVGIAGPDLPDGRPTPVKTRVIARHQQVVRLDEEQVDPVPDAAAEALRDAALAALDGASALIVSDYGKGLLDGRNLPELLRAARASGIPAVVDPKLRNVQHYGGALVITPNLAEATRAAALDPGEPDAAERAGRRLLERLDVEAVLVTLGEKGMLLVRRGAPPVAIPARAREVFDVTGAGDTVAAVLGAALAAGLDLEAGARLANAAAAIAVGRLGTAAVGADELRAVLEEQT